MAYDVFISCVGADRRTADTVRAALARDGLSCCVASSDLPRGAASTQLITQAVHSSSVLVLVFTLSANVSVAVRLEVEAAAARGIPIIVVRPEFTVPHQSWDSALRSAQWIDISSPPVADHVERLRAAVKQTLSRPKRPTPDPPATEPTVAVVEHAQREPEPAKVAPNPGQFRGWGNPDEPGGIMRDRSSGQFQVPPPEPRSTKSLGEKVQAARGDKGPLHHPGPGDIHYAVHLTPAQAKTVQDVTVQLEGGEPLKLRVPAGAKDGTVLRLPGQGRPGPSGNGDLLVRVQIRRFGFF